MLAKRRRPEDSSGHEIVGYLTRYRPRSGENGRDTARWIWEEIHLKISAERLSFGVEMLFEIVVVVIPLWKAI